MNATQKGEVASLLAQTDSRDRRLIYLAWCQLSGHGQALLPFVAQAFTQTVEARGRESQLYYVTPYARFDDRAVELGLCGLRDPRREVRHRACALLAHSGRVEAAKELVKLEKGSSRVPARKALQALRQGTPFGPDDDPSYFIYGHEPYRAPRGSFAVELQAELGAWPKAAGLHPTYCFQHTLEYRDARRIVSAEWDSYDVEARVWVRTPRRRRPDQETIRAGAGDVARIAAVLRSLVGTAPSAARG